jgi:putative oxidoreductase
VARPGILPATNDRRIAASRGVPARQGEKTAMFCAAYRAAWHPYMLSILRIMLALLYLQHGLSKVIGFPVAGPASLSALLTVAAVIETLGSLLLLVGLFTPVAALLMSGEMAVAYFMLRPSVSFYPLANRGEAEVLFCFAFLYLVFAGGGPWSLDALLARRPARA